jgi:hypothetical protein
MKLEQLAGCYSNRRMLELGRQSLATPPERHDSGED